MGHEAGDSVHWALVVGAPRRVAPEVKKPTRPVLPACLVHAHGLESCIPSPIHLRPRGCPRRKYLWSTPAPGNMLEGSKERVVLSSP